VDVIYSRFSPKGKLIVDILFTLFFFFPLIIMLINAFWHEVLHSYQVKEEVWMAAWHPILWPVKAMVTLGFCLLLLQGIATFLRDVMALVKGGNEPW
jgi:TRAP-type mannitol/chloroaromatic compound transport system permease small subunit